MTSARITTVCLFFFLEELVLYLVDEFGCLFLEAATAEWFVGLRFAEEYLTIRSYRTVAEGSEVAASYADSVCLEDLVSNSHEGRHRTERYALIVHVETCYDNAYAAAGQLTAYIDDTHVEELCLVDAYYLYVFRQQQDAARRLYGSGHDGVVVVTDHFLFAIAGVDSRFEDFHFLLSKLCTTHTANQFFGLTREHRTAYDLYRSAALVRRLAVSLRIHILII